MNAQQVVQAILASQLALKPTGSPGLSPSEAQGFLQMVIEDESLRQGLFNYLASSISQSNSQDTNGDELQAPGQDGKVQRLVIVPRPLNQMATTFDDNGKPNRVEFYWVDQDQDDEAYFGSTAEVGTRDLTPRHIAQSLERVPDEKIYPKVPHEMDVERWEQKIYIKRPKIGHVQDFTNLGVPDLALQVFLAEAEAFEFLRAQDGPWNPGIVRYHGCVVNRGRITGIVLDRLPTTLMNRFQGGGEDVKLDDFNVKPFMEKLTGAIKYLHSLGRAHNDLNPNNIMLTAEDAPVIIDFDACVAFGHKNTNGGTHGWIGDDFERSVSASKHDLFALDKIQKWVEDRVA